MGYEGQSLAHAAAIDRPNPAASQAEAPASVVPSIRAIYHEFHGVIAGLIYRRTGDAHVTEDLTADVFLAAFRGLHRFRGDVPVGVWLRRIAHHRVNRWARREAGLRGILRRLPMLGTILPDHTKDLDLSPALRALLRLRVDQQAILSAHYVEGMSLKETAMMLSITPAAAKSRLARAREALSHALDQAPRTEHHS